LRQLTLAFNQINKNSFKHPYAPNIGTELQSDQSVPPSNMSSSDTRKQVDDSLASRISLSYLLNPVSPPSQPLALDLADTKLDDRREQLDAIVASNDEDMDVMPAPRKDAFSALQREKLENKTVGTKRKHGQVATEADEDGSRVGKRSKSRGQSKSTVWERLQNHRHTFGTLRANNHKLATFRAKIARLDPHSEVIHGKLVRHFKCGKMHQMKYAYNVQNFETHITTCSGPSKNSKLPAGGMLSIHSYFQNPRTSETPSSSIVHMPCLGLSEADTPKIQGYLQQTGAHGSGASSVTVIALELYGKKYKRLSESQKSQVKITQKHEWLWRNNANAERVFSTACQGHAGGSVGSPQPCFQCPLLLKNKKFKNVLQVPQPPDKNYKCINHEYRNKALVELYGHCVDLHAIMEAGVSNSLFNIKMC
jgi:hypothetical protein